MSPLSPVPLDSALKQGVRLQELEKEAWGKMCDLLTRQHDSDKHPQAALSRDVVLLQIWSPNPRHSGPGLPATPYGPVCARLAVGGVPDGSGADTGSVVVGETILPLPGAGRALLLTSEVPGLASWSINGFEGRQEHKLASQLRARALEGGRREAAGKGAIARPAGDAREALVRPVLHPVKCPLLTGVAAASRVPGTLLCFSDGLAFLAEWLGHPLALPLSQRHVSSVEVDVSDAAGVGAVRMILTDAVQWAPVTLCADFSRCIRLDVTAMPASDGRAFRSRVLPDWQLQCKVQEILWHVRHVGPTDEHEASQGAEGPTADLLRPAGALEHADLDSIDAYASAMRAPGAAALWRHREAGMGESSAPGPMEALGEETEVHVWLAQPGIKLPELAQRLVELTGRRKGWAVAAKPETGWPSSQGAESALLPLLHSSADAMLRGAVATARAAAGPGERAAVVLCLWGMGCAGLAVQQLSSLPAFTAHRCRLCTVTAVVSAASVGSLSPHPLLCGAAGPSSLLIPGLVDNVVFVASAYDDIALAGRVASERCGSCRVYRTNALSGAGPEIWEPLQRRWEERLDLCLSATGWGSRPPSYPHGPAHAVACAASGTIDRDRLVEELEKHMDASEAAWAEVLPLEEAPGESSWSVLWLTSQRRLPL